MVFAGSIVLLILGGEYFVESSVSIASHLRVPRILIGTTLVSLATTAPELAVSATASWQGESGIAIGNAIGSAIANIGLILGLLCVLRPMHVRWRDFAVPSWVMVAMGAVLLVITLPLRIERRSGIVLIVCGVAYLGIDYWRNRPRPGTEPETVDSGAITLHSMPVSIALFLGCSAVVIVGSRLLCWSSIEIATAIGIPSIIIGLTLVAFGTSVPELVTAIHAARKGVPDLSLGNVVGANILNLTLVTGTAASITPLTLAAAHQRYNLPAMLAIFILLKILARTGHRLTRKEGWILIGSYGVYLIGLMVTGSLAGEG